jgi:hypothetical protein
MCVHWIYHCNRKDQLGDADGDQRDSDQRDSGDRKYSAIFSECNRDHEYGSDMDSERCRLHWRGVWYHFTLRSVCSASDRALSECN